MNVDILKMSSLLFSKFQKYHCDLKILLHGNDGNKIVSSQRLPVKIAHSVHSGVHLPVNIEWWKNKDNKYQYFLPKQSSFLLKTAKSHIPEHK